MTTAHKPTFHPAIGTANQGGYRYHAPRQQFSARDLPTHTKLKRRQVGQSAPEEVEVRDLKRELEDRERAHEEDKNLKRRRKGFAVEDAEPPLAILANKEVAKELEKFNDDDYSSDSGSDSEGDGSDSDDEEAELLRELEKIKAERAQERARKEKEENERVEKEREERILKGNPLMAKGKAAGGGAFEVEERWDQDIVFRHQSRDEPEVQQRFINDPTRNDFHLRFMNKYIQ